MTLRMFEELEVAAGLGFGELARSMVLGERLLRFQWYPAVTDGVPAEFEVTTPSGNVRIRGLQAGATRIVRASPHTDTGHWTWQVAATDDGVRFVDRMDGTSVTIPGADCITGNVCDFLEVEQPRLQAPVHWVDFLDPQQPRASLSYFAHARPATLVRGELAGERLYRKLWEMGYAAPEDVESVKSLLSQRAAADAELVPRVIALETQSEAWPAGFASGIGRYYDPHGRPRRDPPGPLPPVPYDASS
jgi:limonene-1,2-epoxide hydrolase